MNPEEQVKREACDTWLEIDTLIMKTKAEREAADRELEALNRRLPEMLLAMAKGIVSRDEVKALKARIAELKETIYDIPIIIQGLEKEKRQRCYRPLEDALFIAKGRQKYNELKELMAMGFESDQIDTLRQYAQAIDEEEDCERFLVEIRASLPSKH